LSLRVFLNRSGHSDEKGRIDCRIRQSWVSVGFT
jgi:hypothetical protein